MPKSTLCILFVSAATFVNFCGIGNDEIKAQGNWRSECFYDYVVRDDQLRDTFSKAVRDKLVFGVFGGFGPL